MRRSSILASLLLLSTFGATAAAGATAHAGEPIDARAPWARTTDDPPPFLERLTGRSADALAAAPSHWEGDMLFTGDGLGASALAALGVGPLPAMAYEASPGILFVEMGGVTLQPTCGNGEIANAARNCSPLVSAETAFPSYGNGMAQATMFQQLKNYYAPFNIVLTAQRPPDWLPYTMAVIGGASNQGPGVCGVANVACDGLKRNHVSLTFPQSCNGVAEIAAQETSHNWGLEHTDDTTDLMYPFANGGFKTYVDTCNDISHATGNGVTQCGYIHQIHCPGGGGEQQNSFQELLGVFGARVVDDVAPVIVSISPEDGAVFERSDSITVTARVEENSRMVGAKWTWVAGLQEGVTEYTKCTNKVCTDPGYDFGPSFDPNAVAWDFVNLSQAPVGTYTFAFEVMDAYGNYDSREVTFEVVEDADDGGSDPDSGGAADGGGTDAGGDDDDGGAGGGGGGDDSDGDGTGGSLGGADDGGAEGCACAQSPAVPAGLGGVLPLPMLGLAVRRR